MIYLNNQLEARPSSEVVAAMLPFLSKHGFSLSSNHSIADHARACAVDALDLIYDALGLETQDSFILTSSHTEAINHLVLALTHFDERERKHFITSKVAEAPQILSMSRASKMGAQFQMVDVNFEGIVEVETLKKAVTDQTGLISLNWANGLTGVIQPLEEISTFCQKRGIYLHVDATHVIGKGDFDFLSEIADFFTFNAEQIHGPRSCGGLVIKKDRELAPLILGGQEQGQMRGGRVDVSQLVGLAKALEFMKQNQDYLIFETARLRDLFEEKLVCCAESPFKNTQRIPTVALLTFEKVHSDFLACCLSLSEIYASIGGNLFQKLSYLLENCGFPNRIAHTAISFALDRNTISDEIDTACEEIIKKVQLSKKIVGDLL